ncbi:MAG: UvrD-helicase domain-containing protein, partial [Ktedonobacteraceae bacterium]
MLVDILVSDTFDQSLQQLTPSMQENVFKKVKLLAQNPAHPSLNTHRLHKARGNIWDCYISDGMRLLYEIKEGTLRLWDIGSHAIVDTVHLRGFAAHTRFSRKEMGLPAVPGSPAVKPQKLRFEPSPATSIPPVQMGGSQQGSPNHFTYFQNAHLRVLGVPVHMVQPLKQAPTLESALSLPGLPVRTRLWLEELSTSTELGEIMFDSSRLLYRSTLNRLEGYCEGKVKRLMLNLQRPEQQQYVDMERAPLILLKGAAGSGKTTVGIYRAIHMAEQGRRVLVLTYSTTLSSVTKSLIEELIGPLPTNLRVTTVHSLMSRLLRSRSSGLNIAEEFQLRGYLKEAVR